MKARLDEANEFYDTVILDSLNADQKNVMRQAQEGMLWGKQFYYHDIHSIWKKEGPIH